MQLGMIGLGRMGANMVRRLINKGHNCVVFDRSPQAASDLVKKKATGAASLAEFVKKGAVNRCSLSVVRCSSFAVRDHRCSLRCNFAGFSRDKTKRAEKARFISIELVDARTANSERRIAFLRPRRQSPAQPTISKHSSQPLPASIPPCGCRCHPRQGRSKYARRPRRRSAIRHCGYPPGRSRSGCLAPCRAPRFPAR